MNLNLKSMARHLLNDQSGQIFPWMAMLVVFIFAGLCALVVDIGRAEVAYHMLQSATDAAVMAGAQVMPTATSNSDVTAQAKLFGAEPGNKNANTAMLPNASTVSGYPAFYCSSTVEGWGVLPNPNLSHSGPIPSAVGCGNGANALVVEQTVTVPMYFGSLIGFPNIVLTARSTAAMKGTARQPYNVAVIVDTTASMNSTDGNTQNCGNLSRTKCSLEGVIELLGDLTPCQYGDPCGQPTGSGNASNVKNPFDEVALYTFPGLTSTANATNDATCGGTALSGSAISSYTYPTTPTYQIVGYSSDYASSNPTTVTAAGTASSALNAKGSGSGSTTPSNLVEAAGNGIPATSGCGLQALGGAGTYYAGIITQAQADLVAQYNSRLPTQTQNIMIILSDGDASTADITAGTYDYNYSTNPLTTNAGIPSPFNMCQQAAAAAIAAAQAATAGGTTVYTVAYGSQTTGCATDTSSRNPMKFTTSKGKAAATATCSISSGSPPKITCSNPITPVSSNCTISGSGSNETETCTNSSPSGYKPCDTMRAMASSASTFFSDYVAGGAGGGLDPSCVGSNGSDTSLDDIFSFIAGSLQTPRMMPNGTP